MVGTWQRLQQKRELGDQGEEVCTSLEHSQRRTKYRREQEVRTPSCAFLLRQQVTGVSLDQRSGQERLGGVQRVEGEDARARLVLRSQKLSLAHVLQTEADRVQQTVQEAEGDVRVPVVVLLGGPAQPLHRHLGDPDEFILLPHADEDLLGAREPRLQVPLERLAVPAPVRLELVPLASNFHRRSVCKWTY